MSILTLFLALKHIRLVTRRVFLFYPSIKLFQFRNLSDLKGIPIYKPDGLGVRRSGGCNALLLDISVLIIRILTRDPLADLLDPFDLHPMLSKLPRTALVLMHNRYLCDADESREMLTLSGGAVFSFNTMYKTRVGNPP